MGSERTCPRCGTTFTPEGRSARLYCSRSCSNAVGREAQRARDAQHKADILEDIRYLRDNDIADNIARRVGYKSTKGMLKQLYKWGEYTLASSLMAEPPSHVTRGSVLF